MIGIEVSFAEKLATVRYDPAKLRLAEILKRYAGTRYRLALSQPVAAIFRRDHFEVRASAEKLGAPAALVVEFFPRGGSRFTAPPEAALEEPAVPGLEAAGGPEPVTREGASPDDPARHSSLRFPLRLGGRLEPGEYWWPLRFKVAYVSKSGESAAAEGTLRSPLVLLEGAGAPTAAGSQPALPALVGGSLELTLGHLCGARGCVEHLHRSLEGSGGLVGVLPRCDGGEARADLLARAGETVDVAGLRERLRERGIEALRLVPRGFKSFEVLLEGGPHPCTVCRDRAIAAVLSVAWAGGVAAEGERLRIRSSGGGEPDLVALLDVLDRAGTPARALWIVPAGVSAPGAVAPAATRGPPSAHPPGSKAHPRIGFEIDHRCRAAAGLVDLLEREVWPSAIDFTDRSPGDPAVIASVRERRHAELIPLLRDARAEGLRPRSIQVSGFGDLRLQLEFGHLCGEVEYSKPPERKREKPDAEGKEEKPFVPRPLRPAPSSPARIAIEKALAGVRWVKEGAYREYHTRPEFDGPRSLSLALETGSEEAIPLDPLLEALARAGFPPTALRVSRLFPGLSFGSPLPGDVELRSAAGETVPLGSLRRPGRPLALIFAAVKLTTRDKKAYRAEPGNYWRLRESLRAFRERADFALISSNPEDSLPEVAEFFARAGLDAPLLHDPDGRARAILNAQLTPPPHVYLFDGDGRLRYAGDPHDRWEKTDQPHRDYLARALERVLAGRVEDNHAAFFNSAKCNCSHPGCKCPKCGCGSSCRCAIGHCKVGF